MKALISLIFIFSLTYAETANFKKGAFGCQNSDDIKGFWRAFNQGRMQTFKYMYQNKCALLQNGSWKIVKKKILFTKVCSDDNYCYWVENEFFN